MAGASDNGGWSSDGGSPDDLPDLPEEWGVIVIPDDLSELSDEVEAVREELRLTGPPTRWQRFARRPAIRRVRRLAGKAMRAPVLIISMAVLVTVASLFASAWPGPPRQPAAQRTAATTNESATMLPALELFGDDGRTVPLNRELPAVILLVDGCACAKLVSDTVAAVRPDIAVVTVTSAATASAAITPPTNTTPQALGKTVRSLHDPTGTLRSHLKLGAPDGTATALLVSDDHAKIVKTFPRIASIEDMRPYLAQI
ncbi:hypothetical protein [Paractinoplanes atraurantiacus]|uniref:Uncharacterized protein n=1 Tax=Paractinoplanes atraurantiacus TaxID=1036182 RepID=A0A285EZL8_9ACTN|nr:hypothetical protein [Actinoplanes atraurantiacus]SNY04528.1 hypothetical protein SAMN05421748_101251 [Actinoplanes atraurantiacus]